MFCQQNSWIVLASQPKDAVGNRGFQAIVIRLSCHPWTEGIRILPIMLVECQSYSISWPHLEPPRQLSLTNPPFQTKEEETYCLEQTSQILFPTGIQGTDSRVPSSRSFLLLTKHLSAISSSLDAPCSFLNFRKARSDPVHPLSHWLAVKVNSELWILVVPRYTGARLDAIIDQSLERCKAWL